MFFHILFGKKLISFLSTVLITLFVFSMPCQSASLSDVVKANRNSIIYIYVEKDDETTGVIKEQHGTGFIINSEGYVLTAAHIVRSDAGTQVNVRGAVGSREGNLEGMEVLYENSNFDVALLRFKNTSVQRRAVSIGDPWKIVDGAIIYSMGFPGTEEWFHDEGKLSGKGPKGSWNTTLTLNPGMSGGPIFDIEGNVVAMVWGGVSTQGIVGVNRILPINLLIDPLQIAGVTSAILLSPRTSTFAADEDNTEFIKAAFSAKSETIKQLLDKGINVDFQNKMGFSALIIASQYGHADIVDLLLANNANIDLKNASGATALIIASKNGHAEVVNTLLAKFAKVDMQTTDGITALMLAAQKGHESIVDALLAKGANVNLPTKDKVTALMIAALEGRTSIVDKLLSKNAQINLQASDNTTALYMAARNGHTAIIETLLKKNAPIDQLATNQTTALHIAAQNGHVDVVNTLLAKGAKIELKDKNDATALTIAALYGNTEIVELLLKHGAKEDHKAANGFTPLILAAQNEHTPIIVLLLAHGAKIDLQNDDGVTALMWAAFHDHINAVKSLLEKGANTKIKSKTGKTALEMAKDPAIIELLKTAT